MRPILASDETPDAGSPYLGPDGLERLTRTLLQAGNDFVDVPLWQIWYLPENPTHSKDKNLQAPWDIAHVTITERGLNPNHFPKPDQPWRIPRRRLPGEGALAGQLATLPFFSLETGTLLHSTISIQGFAIAPGREKIWQTTIHAWEIGAEGYDIRSAMCPSAPPLAPNADASPTLYPILRLFCVTEDCRYEVARFPT